MAAVLPNINVTLVDPQTGRINELWYRYFFQRELDANLASFWRMNGLAFANLPTVTTGSIAVVTDSNTNTWGATIAGGGANTVLAFYNGTNWTVAGR